MSKTRIEKRLRAGNDHAVVVLVGGTGLYRREPCAECPWRLDQVGKFPAQAFRHSAPTAYDMARQTFACHLSRSDKPATCAGFLLRGAVHNLKVRFMLADGKLDPDAISSAVPLHDSYRAMAEANGVDPDDPVLAPCREGTYDRG